MLFRSTPLRRAEKYVEPSSAHIASGEFLYPEGGDVVAWRLQAMRDEALRKKALKAKATDPAMAVDAASKTAWNKGRSAAERSAQALEESKAAFEAGDGALGAKLREKAKIYGELDRAYGDAGRDPTGGNRAALREWLDILKNEHGETF